MGTTEDKLRHLLKTKTDIMYALRAKGVEIDENTPFSEYDVKVKNIQGGGDVILCKDMVELMDALPAPIGTLALVYDPDIDIFLGIFEVKEDETWGYVPTQLNARAEHIAPGYRAYSAEGLVNGTFTTDATAASDDIIGDKTAYINGEKVTGTMVPEYDASEPTLMASTINMNGYTLDDINLKYGIGVRVASTSSFRIYKIVDNEVTQIKTYSPAGLNSALTSFWTGISAVAYEPEDNKLRVYTLAKDGSNTYVCGMLVDLEDYSVSNIVCSKYRGNSSGNPSHTPSIAAIPTTTNKVVVCVPHHSGADHGFCIYCGTVTKSSYSYFAIDSYLGQNSSSTSSGSNGQVMQFSEDGLTFIFTGFPKWWYNNSSYTSYLIARFNANFTSVTILEYNDKASGTRLLLLTDKLFIKGSYIYAINTANNTIGASLSTSPISLADYSYKGCTIGTNFFYIASTSATAAKVYTVSEEDGTLTYKNDITNISTYNHFCRYGRNFLYYPSSTLRLTGYENGALGTLSALTRQGIKYFGILDSTAEAADILTGKKAYITGGKVKGTMPNRGARIITPGDYIITIPAGYHNGSGYVKAINYEGAGTITPEDYTEAQTQINDLFGEEVNE